MKLHYDTDVWLDLEGNQYWTSQSGKQAANDYKSYVLEQTIDEISPKLINSEHPNHRQYVNQNYKLITVNPGSEAREDHDLLLPLVLYSTAPITPKAPSKQKDKKLVAAEEKAIKDEMKSSADNGVIKAVNWKDIPKESKYEPLPLLLINV